MGRVNRKPIKKELEMQAARVRQEISGLTADSPDLIGAVRQFGSWTFLRDHGRPLSVVTAGPRGMHRRVG